MADSEQQPLPELLPGLVEAVTTVARLELPETSDIYYYRNIPEYKQLSSSASSHIQQLLRTARSSLTRPATAVSAAAQLDDDDDVDEQMYSDLVAVLDDTLERLDAALDASEQQTEQLKLGGWAVPARNKQLFRKLAAGRSGAASVAAVTGVSRGKVQRHVAHLARPQDAFADPVDNSNTPWDPAKHSHIAAKLAAAKTAAVSSDPLAAHAAQLAAASGSSHTSAVAPHPYAAELASLVYQDWQLSAPELPLPAPADFDATPFSFVDTAEALADMVAALAGEKQIAMDLEHHSYRSFQGFTCLMQVSTRSADWVVDTLALRGQLGPALAGILADPAVEKVLHGADHDVQWLQRDFGLYVVNMFDTGQAARVLNYPSASLAYLLERHFGFKPDKRYQLADWRVRPLSADMLHYARADTHFLLSAADALRAELVATGPRVPQGWSVHVPAQSGAKQDALGVVFERSRLICLSTYQKPLLSEYSYLEAAARWGLALPAANMAVFGALYAWRDTTARRMDESVSYIMPKAALLELSRAAPQTALGLKQVLGSGSGLTGGSGLLLTRAEEVASVVQAGLQQAPSAKVADAARTEAGGVITASLTPAVVGPTTSIAVAAVKPRELPALKPKVMPALLPKKGIAGAAASGGLHGMLGPCTTATAAAATPLASSVATGIAAEQVEHVGNTVGTTNMCTQHQQQQDLGVLLQSLQHGLGSEHLQEQHQQQVQLAPQIDAVEQPQPHQPAELIQPFCPGPNAVPAPKQLSSLCVSRKGSSSVAGLLSKRHQHRQHQPSAAKAAALKATSFGFSFLEAPKHAATMAATQCATEQQQQQQHHQQRLDKESDGASHAEVTWVTGSQVRAVVNAMMADADTMEGQQVAASAVADLGSQSPDEALHNGSRSTSALADMDYVPLSELVRRPGSTDHAALQHCSEAVMQQAGDEATCLGRAKPAPVDQQQQYELQQKKRKRGIFDEFAGGGSDSGSSSEDDRELDGTLPSCNPTATRRHQDVDDGREQQGRTLHNVDDGCKIQQGNGIERARGGGRGSRGRRDSRGGRGGRSKRGGFMAAASASLAAVRKQQGTCVSGNPFAIPDSNLMRAGKRSSTVPRGGNKSASFK